uniref:Uncharacterized protein n=1 Tax=Arundo donax TaxID=35708 RepID=A0A0A8ZUH3_ARUDO
MNNTNEVARGLCIHIPVSVHNCYLTKQTIQWHSRAGMLKNRHKTKPHTLLATERPWMYLLLHIIKIMLFILKNLHRVLHAYQGSILTFCLLRGHLSP